MKMNIWQRRKADVESAVTAILSSLNDDGVDDDECYDFFEFIEGSYRGATNTVGVFFGKKRGMPVEQHHWNMALPAFVDMLCEKRTMAAVPEWYAQHVVRDWIEQEFNKESGGYEPDYDFEPHVQNVPAQGVWWRSTP